MQVRTQLAVIAVIAAGWGAGNFTVVHPVLAESSQSERQRFIALENAVERNPDDVNSARPLAQHYLDMGAWRLLVDKMNRMSPGVQHDGRVALLVARALEQLGELEPASARLSGALNRCHSLPPELFAGAGCDVRTQIDLAFESRIVDRLLAWHVNPATDPERAVQIRELLNRPVRFVH